MARGVPTDEDIVLKFRAEYLRIGNAARAARRIGVPTRTGQEWAKKADEEPEFAQLRAALHARAMAEVETLAADVARRSHIRFCAKWEPPEVDADSPLAAMTVKDPRPDYGKLVMDGLRSLSQHRARVMPGDGADSRPDEIVFRRYVPTETEDEQPPWPTDE